MPGTQQHFRIFLWMLLGIAWCSGCSVFQRDLGPIYRISRKYRAKPTSTPITTVSLKCRDRRPEWARQYQRTPNDPKRNKRAIELLTADNFQPDPINQFKLQLTQRLSELNNPPTSAEVIIKRMHVVVKYDKAGPPKISLGPHIFSASDDDDLQVTQDDRIVRQVRIDDAYMTARKKWGKADLKAKSTGSPSPKEPKYEDYNRKRDDESSEFKEEIASTIAAALLQGMVHLVWQIPRWTDESIEAVRFYTDQGPPPDWAKVGPGVTCEISGQVNLAWSSGQKTTIPINVRETFEVQIAPEAPNYEVTPFLAGVIIRTTEHIAQRSTEFLERKAVTASAIARSHRLDSRKE